MENMTTDTKALSQIAQLINDRIDDLKGEKSQRDIAREVGYRNQNMITMLKQGDAKVALDRVPLLAQALEVDEAHLLRLAMEQFYSKKTTDALLTILGGGASKNELEILKVIRDASGDTDPKLTPETEMTLRSIF
jgi:transcriptional regulator with XRE-family HTH domain